MKCPTAIRLLMKLWEVDSRFVPDSVRRSPIGAEWRWDGAVDQSGQAVSLERFNTWNKLDQQTLLETVVGKIFSVGSAYSKTVIQLHDKTVSVKHRELKEIRRFSAQPTMLGNLFNALIKMSETAWIPLHLGKDGCYYYTEEDRSVADTYYEVEMAAATKRAMAASQKSLAEQLAAKPEVSGILPANDPFAGASFDRI